MPRKLVEIEGLNEWRAAMKAADLTDAVKETNHKVARHVADRSEDKRDAQRRQFPSYSLVTIKAGRAQTGATVTVGPKQLGAAAEWGANTHPVFGRKLPQTSFVRRVWPAHSRDGQMVHPTVEQERPEIEDMYMDAMVKELKPAFPT